MGTATLESINPSLTEDRRWPYHRSRGIQRRKERVTVGIGFKRADGIVLATDAQYTSSMKTRGEKIFDLTTGEELRVCVAGAATPAMLINEAARLINGRLPSALHSAEDLLDVVESALGLIHKRHIYKYAGPEGNRPAIELLIGAWSAQVGLILIQTSTTVANLVSDSDYGKVGTGSYVAQFVVDTLGQQWDSVEDAKYLAVCAVKAAKDYDPNCGKGTQSRIMRADGQIEKIPQDELIDAESYFDNLWDSVGFLLIGLNTDGVTDEDVDILPHPFKVGITEFRNKQQERKRKGKK